MILSQNTFNAGRDSDSVIIPQGKYRSAFNLELVGDGKFQALKNIAGTTQVKQIQSSSSVRTIGTFKTKYLIGGSLYDCLLDFTATATTLNIRCHNVETNTLYDLYQESVDSDYLTEDRTAALFPEGGTDYIYFSDFYNEVRYIKCEIPSPYSPNFLSAYDISLNVGVR